MEHEIYEYTPVSRAGSFLTQAANRNDVDLMRATMSGMYGDFSQEDLNQALLRAANNGSATCVSILLEAGADVAAVDMDGDTALMLAVGNNHIKVVSMLLKAQCDIQLTSDHQRTVLHMAAWNGHCQLVKMLLEAGVDINVQEMYGETALDLAILKRHPKIVRYLLDEGCRLDLQDKECNVALHHAAKAGNEEVVRWLVGMPGIDLNPVEAWGRTPLMLAAMKNHAGVVQVLVEAGCDINMACRYQRSALHFCASRGFTECVQMLLEHGADTELRDEDGNVPLMLAVQKGHASSVGLLVGAGCNMDIEGHVLVEPGLHVVRRPLYLALWYGFEEIARLLHRAGGCSNASLQAMLDCQHLRQQLQRHPAALEWLDSTCSSPLPLLQLCRQAIWKCLNPWPYRLRSVALLQLPLPLQRFLEETCSLS